jgi:hemerythrin
MPVLWQDAMSVGHKIIDDEHKYLICLINSVELALRLEDNEKVMKMLIEQLEEYTHSHFVQEEKIQLKMKYPAYVEHKQEHQRILSQIAELKAKLFESLEQRSAAKLEADPTGAKAAFDGYQPASPKSQSAVEFEVVELLRSWILEHVLQTDMKMKKFLSRLPENFA